MGQHRRRLYEQEMELRDWRYIFNAISGLYFFIYIAIIDFFPTFLLDLPALVYPFCSDSSSLGNWLGLYLNEASCALISGGHLLSPSLVRIYLSL
jgi:hypothetical protein